MNLIFFVFFKFTQMRQTAVKIDVSISGHFVDLKLFDRRSHIRVTSAPPFSMLNSPLLWFCHAIMIRQLNFVMVLKKDYISNLMVVLCCALLHYPTMRRTFRQDRPHSDGLGTRLAYSDGFRTFKKSL